MFAFKSKLPAILKVGIIGRIFSIDTFFKSNFRSKTLGFK